MKRISTLFAVLLLAPCLTGCFTGLSRNVGAGTWSPSKPDAIVMGALDVATLPIQAPFLAKIAIDQSKGKAAAQKLMEQRAAQLAEIRRDPEYLFRHRSSVANETVRAAIEDHTIPFTEAQLRRFAGPNDWTRPIVLATPRCPKDLLAEAWLGLAQLQGPAQWSEANALVSNPNVPDAWLETMILRPDIYRRTSSRAKEMLEKRRREAAGGPAPTPPPAGPQPNR